MYKFNKLTAWTVIGIICLQGAYLKAQITADDFLPVVQGGPADVRQPQKVVIKKDTVTAATAQDAVNTAVKENNSSNAFDEFPSFINCFTVRICLIVCGNDFLVFFTNPSNVAGRITPLDRI